MKSFAAILLTALCASSMGMPVGNDSSISAFTYSNGDPSVSSSASPSVKPGAGSASQVVTSSSSGGQGFSVNFGSPGAVHYASSSGASVPGSLVAGGSASQSVAFQTLHFMQQLIGFRDLLIAFARRGDLSAQQVLPQINDLIQRLQVAATQRGTADSPTIPFLQQLQQTQGVMQQLQAFVAQGSPNNHIIQNGAQAAAVAAANLANMIQSGVATGLNVGAAIPLGFGRAVATMIQDGTALGSNVAFGISDGFSTFINGIFGGGHVGSHAGANLGPAGSVGSGFGSGGAASSGFGPFAFRL